MKGKLFHIGQEVTPNTQSGCYAQMFGKIYTIIDYMMFPAPFSGWGIRFREIPFSTESGLPHYYAQEAFSPVITDNELVDLVGVEHFIGWHFVDQEGGLKI